MNHYLQLIYVLAIASIASPSLYAQETTKLIPLAKTIDLNIGETANITQIEMTMLKLKKNFN